MGREDLRVSFIHLMEYGRMANLLAMELLIILQVQSKKDFIKMDILDMAKGRMYMRMVSLMLETSKNK